MIFKKFSKSLNRKNKATTNKMIWGKKLENQLGRIRQEHTHMLKSEVRHHLFPLWAIQPSSTYRGLHWGWSQDSLWDSPDSRICPTLYFASCCPQQPELWLLLPGIKSNILEILFSSWARSSDSLRPMTVACQASCSELQARVFLECYFFQDIFLSR